MSIIFQDALDAIYGIAKAAIDANNSIVGYAPDVRYPGVPKATRPDMSKLWMRVSAIIIADNASALANALGKQLYEANGIVNIQLFCPRNVAGSRDPQGLSFAEAIRTAFRTTGSIGEIWFTNVKIGELPETVESYPIVVSAKFSYRTVAA